MRSRTHALVLASLVVLTPGCASEVCSGAPEDGLDFDSVAAFDTAATEGGELASVEWLQLQIEKGWGPCLPDEDCVSKWIVSFDKRVYKSAGGQGESSSVMMSISDFDAVDAILSSPTFVAMFQEGFGCTGFVTDVNESFLLKLTEGLGLWRDVTNCAYGENAKEPVLTLHDIVTKY